MVAELLTLGAPAEPPISESRISKQYEACPMRSKSPTPGRFDRSRRAGRRRIL